MHWSDKRVSVPALAAATVALVLTSGACGFSDGDPWGQLQVSTAAYMAPPASRLTEEGRLKTSNSYALELTSLTVRIDTLEVVSAASSGGATAVEFDPADPPPGYSLCHNGHCHKDDGSLPTYAEIRAELAQNAGQGGGGVSTTLSGPVDLIPMTATPTEVSWGPCPDQCWFDQGVLSEARLQVGRLVVVGRVYDLLSGDARRIPQAGLEVAIDVELDLALTQPLDLAFGPESEPRAVLESVLSVPASLFDAIDWAVVDQATPQDAQALLRTGLTTAWSEADGSFSATAVTVE